MALRDQPYIPLYIQDFLTDEKLIECSAASTGVYVRIMCIMHKSEHYGKILLKQKDKQSLDQNKNFAIKLTKQMPYPEDVVLYAINELLSEGVLSIEEDFLCQKRMIRDNQLSLVRSNAGSKGGKIAQAKTKASDVANTENATENENTIGINLKKESLLKIDVFNNLFDDEQYVDDLSITHKGKSLNQAFEECWLHWSNSKNPPDSIGEWKQKLNSWLINMKPGNNGHNKLTSEELKSI